MSKAPLVRALRFVLHPHGLVVFEVARDEGFALLDWLGLGRPEFGAIDARALLPRCRRRLWPELDKPAHAALRALVARLLVTLEMHPDAVIQFG